MEPTHHVCTSTITYANEVNVVVLILCDLETYLYSLDISNFLFRFVLGSTCGHRFNYFRIFLIHYISDLNA